MMTTLAAMQVAAPQAPAESPLISSAVLSAALPELAAMPGVVLTGYPVSGRSPRALRESINDSRPREPGGDPFDGLTTWRYSTRWGMTQTGDCDPSSAEVTATVVVTLPELTSREQLDRRELEAWDLYLKRLAAHEANHVRVALAGIDQLRTFMRGAPNCATMQAAQSQISESIRTANAEYDAATRHGATEGARYP